MPSQVYKIGVQLASEKHGETVRAIQGKRSPRATETLAQGTPVLQIPQMPQMKNQLCSQSFCYWFSAGPLEGTHASTWDFANSFLNLKSCNVVKSPGKCLTSTSSPRTSAERGLEWALAVD